MPQCSPAGPSRLLAARLAGSPARRRPPRVHSEAPETGLICPCWRSGALTGPGKQQEGSSPSPGAATHADPTAPRGSDNLYPHGRLIRAVPGALTPQTHGLSVPRLRQGGRQPGRARVRGTPCPGYGDGRLRPRRFTCPGLTGPQRLPGRSGPRPRFGLPPPLLAAPSSASSPELSFQQLRRVSQPMRVPGGPSDAL